MNISRLKQIVNDLETNYSYVAGSRPATADLLLLFGMSLDRWLIDAVRSLDGDVSTIVRGNETALESALHDVMVDRDESGYYVEVIKPLKQRYRHEPKKGVFGDCHRTCYAMLLGREQEGVPHFAENGPEDFHVNEQSFLEEEGLEQIQIIFPGDTALDLVLQTMNVLNPDKPFILGGMSKIGVGHSVVCFECEMYDPSLDDNGIVGPMSDGYYWITYIVRKL